MITKQHIERAKAKAQEIWDTHRTEDAEDLIKDQIFAEILGEPASNNHKHADKILYLNKLWEEVKDLDEKGYWGFDAVAIEFCKMLERALTLNNLGLFKKGE